MKIFKVNKNIEIVCETKNTRNGFKHTATLFLKGQETDSVKICYLNRTWERYEYQSVIQKLIESSERLSEKEKKLLKNYAGSYKENDNFFSKVSAVMALGNIFTNTKKERNDWKTRMLKAGLGNKGLIMPEDWEELPEDEKELRLNNIIKEFRV